MGADLYIKSLNDKCQEVHKPLFEAACIARDRLDGIGDDKLRDIAQSLVKHHYDMMYEKGYFRDSYNATNTLNQCGGLSRWVDVGKLLDDDGNLPPEKAAKLKAMIEANGEPKPRTLKWLKENHLTVDNDKNSPAVWNKYFFDCRIELLHFLQTAIELNEPIECSI